MNKEQINSSKKNKQKSSTFNNKKFGSILKLSNAGRLSHALTELEKYLAEYPEDKENCLLEYAIILFKLNDYEGSEKILNKILCEGSDFYVRYTSYYRLGLIKEKQNLFEESKKYYEKALANSEGLYAGYSYLRLAKLALRDGDLIKTEELLDKVNDIRNTNARIVYDYYLCKLRYLQGNYAAAKQIINTLNKKRLSEGSVNESFKKEIEVLRKNIYNGTIGYYNRSLINYDLKEAIGHVLERHIDDNNKYEFNSDTDLEKLFSTVLNQINDSNKISDCYADYFIIDCPKGFGLDCKLKVVCLPSSKNIISMYPCDESKEINKGYYESFMDDNLEKENGTSLKKSKVSQIDKFNARYNKKSK